MLICLYVLPKTMSRYAVTSNDSYYANNCVGNVASNLGIPYGNGTYNNGSPDATWYCNVMNFCGFPLNNSFSNPYACPLYKVSLGVSDLNYNRKPISKYYRLTINVPAISI